MKYYFFSINSYGENDKPARTQNTREFLDGGVYRDWGNISRGTLDFLKGKKIIEKGDIMLGVYVNEREHKVLEDLGFSTCYSHTKDENILYTPSKRAICIT